MRILRVENRTRGRVLGEGIRHARWWWQRFRGLLGTEGLERGGGLLIEPCRAIHMHGMRYPLDVVFLDRGGVVQALYPAIQPGERTPRHARATVCLELPVGTLDESGTQAGDRLAWS